MRLFFAPLLTIMFVSSFIACSEDNNEDQSKEKERIPAQFNITLNIGKTAAGNNIHCLVLSSDQRCFYIINKYKYYQETVAEITEEYFGVTINPNGNATLSASIYPVDLTNVQTKLEVITSDSKGVVHRYSQINPITEIKDGKMYDLEMTEKNLIQGESAIISSKFSLDQAGYYKMVDPRDGKEYATVLIADGNKKYCWMAENLNVGILCKWDYAESGMSTFIKEYYDNNDKIGKEYGGLYSLEAVMQASVIRGVTPTISYPVQGISPIGWHIPSDTEWTYAGKQIDDLKLKLGGFTGYIGEPDYVGMGNEGAWWSSTMHSDKSCLYWYSRHLIKEGNDLKLEQIANHLFYGYSVRCVLNN